MTNNQHHRSMRATRLLQRTVYSQSYVYVCVMYKVFMHLLSPTIVAIRVPLAPQTIGGHLHRSAHGSECRLVDGLALFQLGRTRGMSRMHQVGVQYPCIDAIQAFGIGDIKASRNVQGLCRGRWTESVNVEDRDCVGLGLHVARLDWIGLDWCVSRRADSNVDAIEPPRTFQRPALQMYTATHLSNGFNRCRRTEPRPSLRGCIISWPCASVNEPIETAS